MTTKRPPARTHPSWLKYIGCQGWFEKDGFLVINTRAKVYRASFSGYAANTGVCSPFVTIVGQKGRMLHVSADMLTVSMIAKKYVRIIGE